MVKSLTHDEVFQLAEKLNVDPVDAIVKQFCKNASYDKIIKATDDVKQMSRNMYACLKS